MSEKEIEEIIDQIRVQYGSFESPDFSFVRKAISICPYENILLQLKERFHVKEDTDPNDDVSFAYLLTCADGQWVLRISMVGTYAVLLRLATSGEVVLVSPFKEDITETEKQLIKILSDNGVALLDRDVLSSPVPLELFNTSQEDVRVYQALFTDTDILPWEYNAKA